MRVFRSIFLLFFLSMQFALLAQKDSITVYYFLTEECVVCQQYTPTMNRLYESFNSRNLSFVGLFPNRFSREESIQAFKEKYKLPFELKREYYQSKTKRFGVEITPEVVVYNESKEYIVYKGRIDNLFMRVGKRRRVVTKKELENVLLALQNNEDVTIENTSPVGCYINLIK